MSKIKLELQTGYIADAIIQTKKNRFNEQFATIEEVNVMKEVMQKRVEQKELNVKFVDAFFKKYFDIVNGVITKADKETESLKVYISDIEIRQAIYDEDFIYLCLCEIMIDRLTNSLDHTCSDCNSNCCGGLSSEQAKDCTKWSHDFSSKNNHILKLIK